MVDGDIKAAVAEATAEVNAEPEASTTSTPEPAAETSGTTDDDAAEPEATPEPESTDEPEGLFSHLTAEELAAIDKDPSLRRLAKSMQAGFTKKSMAAAEERKVLAQKASGWDKVVDDPDTTLRALAMIRGVQIVEPQKAPAQKSAMDAAYDQLAETLGPEGAKILRPVFDAVINTAVEQRVGPIERQAAELQRQSVASSIDASLKAFKSEVKANGDDWSPEIESEMAGLVGKVVPAEGTDIKDFLAILHSKVVLDRNRKAGIAAKITRIKDAAASKEPVTGTRSAADAAPRLSEMNDRDAIREAVRLAQLDSRR